VGVGWRQWGWGRAQTENTGYSRLKAKSCKKLVAVAPNLLSPILKLIWGFPGLNLIDIMEPDFPSVLFGKLKPIHARLEMIVIFH
jgi:hypothetical protein